MWHGWIVIRNSDSAVVGTQYTTPAAGAWPAGYTVREVTLPSEPPVHNPADGIESYDPSTPAQRLAGVRVDFNQLAADAQAEIAWLDTNIPRIPTADLALLRVGLERLARQNRQMLKAWLYVLRRMG